MLGRRRFLLSSVAALAACRRQRASGYPGYAFVANREGKSVAVVDLGAFAVAKHIRLEGPPTSVVSHPSYPAVYVLEPDRARIGEIDTDSLSYGRSVGSEARPLQMRLAPDGRTLWVLCREPAQLTGVDVSELRRTISIGLPSPVEEFDLSPDGSHAAVSFGDTGKVALVDLDAGTVIASVTAGASAGTLTYRSDGRVLLVGDYASRTLNLLESGSGGVVVQLPLAVRPENFCVGGGGGQLFITGDGMDAVAVVYPYLSQVAATILAGSAPGYLAASGDALFVTNPSSGDVTVLDIPTSQVTAVVAVGRDPQYITFTPDGRYALVLNRESGDMAVIRIASLAGRRQRFAPLFTLIPVGSEPTSAAVRAI